MENFIFCAVLTDESTDISNHAELFISVRYVDDMYDIKEEFLGMTEIVGNKEAEALLNTISEMFTQKGIMKGYGIYQCGRH